MTWLRRRHLVYALLAISVVGLFGLVLLPVGNLLWRVVTWFHWAGQRLGIPKSVTPTWYEAGLNIVLFAVPTILALLLWPWVRRWVWVVLAFFVSLTIEQIQGLFLPRSKEVIDVLANTSGALLGIAIVSIITQPRTNYLFPASGHPESADDRRHPRGYR